MKKLVLLLLCTVLVSCSKTKVTDLQYKEEGWNVYVYQDGKPYDGIVWSEDGSSYKLTVDCGILKKIEYYSEDGKLFCVVENKEKKFFNEKGNEISRHQARKLYGDKYDHWEHSQQDALNDIVTSHPKIRN